MPHKDLKAGRLANNRCWRNRTKPLERVARALLSQWRKDGWDEADYPCPVPPTTGGLASLSRPVVERILALYWKHEALFEHRMCTNCQGWFLPDHTARKKCEACRPAPRGVRTENLASKPPADPRGNPGDAPARRKCLSCEKMFNSDGFGNRMCRTCKARDIVAGPGW